MLQPRYPDRVFASVCGCCNYYWPDPMHNTAVVWSVSSTAKYTNVLSTYTPFRQMSCCSAASGFPGCASGRSKGGAAAAGAAPALQDSAGR